MKISEMVAALDAVKDKHGDLSLRYAEVTFLESFVQDGYFQSKYVRVGEF